jgi:GTPase SAR1 family protein
LHEAGAEQYKSITRSYYRKSQGVIIMFDMT